MKQLLLILFLGLAPALLHAQRPELSNTQKRGSITGKVTNLNGNPLEGINIYIPNTKYRTQTDKNGNYTLSIHIGRYKLICSGVGFEKSIVEIALHPGKNLNHNFKMKPDHNTDLGEVTVNAKSAITQIKESPFNVVALDAKSHYNSTLDLAHMLGKASGVKIRESGGVGSDVNISLNGFTGRHVKIFMDGVPMQGFGSAFQLNNIPVSVAERIEVYKGVVPIEFGADAIGGVINIVTNQTTNSFLDASYSYGSFNTHRTNVILGHTTNKGFSFQLNAYQNYSDNNYKIKSKVLKENGQYTRDEELVKKFHDTYHNEAIVAKVGFVGKPWADRLFFGLTVSQQDQEIQNSATDIRFVYGARENSGHGILPSLEYYKRNLLIEGLTVRVTGNYNFNNNKNIDTTSYRYNWYGEQTPSPVKGEGGGVNTLSDYKNENYSATANINYRINEKHSLAINNVQSGSVRKMSSEVPLDELTVMETLRRLNLKNVLGVSYRYRHNRHWNLDAFGKNYYQKATGPFNEGDQAHPNYVERTGTCNTTGYGIATTYFLKDYQFKASVERAYRLPTDTELFGDEIQEAGNATLKAENSMNYNFGITLNRELKNQDVLFLDVSGFYRNTQDYIRRLALERFGGIINANHGVVQNIGVDAEARYYYRNKAMIGGTFTYQDLRNKEGLRAPTGSALSGTYNDRMPNVPYLFGNLDAAFYIHGLGGKGNVLNLNYGLNFVGEFYLFWESQGSADSKLILPRQLSHDFSATCIMKNGRYNFTLEGKNITNQELYDNFSMMKAGRAFYAKFRYYLMKRK